MPLKPVVEPFAGDPSGRCTAVIHAAVIRAVWTWLAVAVFTITLAPATVAAAGDAMPVAPVTTPVTTVVAETQPPITANPFFPEERNVTDCIGVLERPGCGNENRGGWRQYAVLGVIAVGLLIVFGNVVRGVRQRQS